MIGFPKEGHLYCDTYLEWVRAQACYFCQRPAPSEPHHHPRKGMGNGLTDDTRTVPVCRECHRRCEGGQIATASGKKMPILKADATAAVDATWRRFFREGPRAAVSTVIVDLYAWREKRGL